VRETLAGHDLSLFRNDAWWEMRASLHKMSYLSPMGLILNYREQSENYQVNSLPLLYSFRRCPYAIRARMALACSGIRVELREVKLNDLPAQMLRLSAKGTVPVLRLSDGRVIDESIDVMRWSLARSDPRGWLLPGAGPGEWIRCNDDEFKPLLDRYKYADRYPQFSQSEHRQNAEWFLRDVESRLRQQAYLSGDRFSLSDAAVLPFLRQFAGVEPQWFAQSRYSATRNWLTQLLESQFFALVMQKYRVWTDQDRPVYF